MNWKEERWAVIRADTTGVDPDTANIVRVEVAHFLKGMCLEAKSQFIDPGVLIPAEASQYSGVLQEDVRGKPRAAEFAPTFLAELSQASVLVSWYRSWQARVFEREMNLAWGRRGLPYLDPLPVVRLDDVGRYWKGQGRHKLEVVANKLNITTNIMVATKAVLTGSVLWSLRRHIPEDDGLRAQHWIEIKQRQQDHHHRQFKWKKYWEESVT